MAYRSASRKRPDEHASRASHQYLIRDPVVEQFLANCSMPEPPADLLEAKVAIADVARPQSDPIRHVVTLDGGYTEVAVREQYPSTTMAFFQFGALMFDTKDLAELADTPFIAPEQMGKLKNIQRFKLALPTKGIVVKGCTTLTESVRRTIYGFFVANSTDESLLATLSWFVFQEYLPQPKDHWILASCPVCRAASIAIARERLGKDYTCKCPKCDGTIWLTDVFRLHEAVDDEIGAGGVLGYVTTLLEQMILVHLMRIILKTKAALLREVLFVKDGPLAYFGQTANMHQPMRALVKYLIEEHALYLVGTEKSGAFVDHAVAIAGRLKPGSVMFLDNDYIHRYIIPGKADPERPYGITTYYGSKVIYKSLEDRMYVLSIPTLEHKAAPKADDLPNLVVLLDHVNRLKCDMYDNALVPIALVNKLVSLSDHPSAAILEKFARQGIAQG